MARSWASVSGVSGSVVQSASQLQVTFTRTSLSELPEEAAVALVEHANIGHAVAEHDEALHADAEGIAGPALGIVADRTEHVGVHHARTEHFEPAARQRPADAA